MAYKQSIEKLTPRHYKILDYSLAGLTTQQISKKLNMSRVQVGIIISSPSFQHQFGLRRAIHEEEQAKIEAIKIDETREAMQASAKAAADKLIGGLTSVDEKIVLKSATEILDRTGYPKEQKINSNERATTQIIINANDFSNLKESLDIDANATENRPAQFRNL